MKAINTNFYGDETRWFIGTVVSHTPPAGYEGRVQVRIRGIHSPSTDDIPQHHLPWAQVVLPGTEEGVSGLGLTAKILSGAQVFGIFVDGQASQVPIVLGSIPKIDSQTPIQDRKNIDKAEYDYPVGPDDKFGYIDSQEEMFAEFKNIKRDVTEVVVHWSETYTNKDISAEDLGVAVDVAALASATASVRISLQTTRSAAVWWRSVETEAAVERGAVP
jgi:hypothetical protein